jgi:hypothetical protein
VVVTAAVGERASLRADFRWPVDVELALTHAESSLRIKAWRGNNY